MARQRNCPGEFGPWPHAAMNDFFFLLASLVAVGGSAVAVTRRNPVYAVLALVLVFASFGVIFATLDAPFLAAAQVIVYGGAILMLFLFVIMMFNLQTLTTTRQEAEPIVNLGALAVAVLVLVVMVLPIAASGPTWEHAAGPEAGVSVAPHDVPEAVAKKPFGSPERVGLALFQRYLVPFEFVSLIILTGIIAAVVLAKQRRREALAPADAGPIPAQSASEAVPEEPPVTDATHPPGAPRESR